MTPEAQRIAIAEVMGEINVRFTRFGYCIASSGQVDGRFWGTHGVPDCLNDLDAMHEAEKVLQDHTKGWENYCILLRRNFVRHDSVIAATAAQRAEAFLRTLNLWTE